MADLLPQYISAPFLQDLLDIGFAVEDFAAELAVGDAAFVAVVLEGAAADFEAVGDFAVGQVAFAVKGGFVVAHKVLDGVENPFKRAEKARDTFVIFGYDFRHGRLFLSLRISRSTSAGR